MFTWCRGGPAESGWYRDDVPPKPRKSDDEATAALLAKAFGGTWTRFEAGPASKVLDGVLWAQMKPNADDRPVLTGVLIFGDRLTAEGLRKVPVSIIEQGLAERSSGTDAQRDAELAKLPALERGDLAAAEFSGLVAEHYRVWARYSPRPAAGMAARWGVKSATVHSWIREARLRGLLPEAERGKRAR